MANILVTGAAGFIGSNFVHYWTKKYPEDRLVILDKLTYAGNLANLAPLIGENGTSNDRSKAVFIKGDICDVELVKSVFNENNIEGVIHFAAESHVDNSIKNPRVFTETNVLGTQVLLETARQKWGEGSENKFVHISTDEVYGTLGENGYFSETKAYAPNSPYSASKAGSDMVARAYYETYKMNVNITNCSNNYGPYQHREKLIPTVIRTALAGEKVPVYGTGQNIRDWLYVEDHCKAIDLVYHGAKAGEKYCVGGHNEMRNIDIVKLILKRLGKSEELIEFVADRKGHDYRYAIDPTKISNELGWLPETKFEDGIVKTVDWYLEHKEWVGLGL